MSEGNQANHEWWQSAVIYQIYPRSFQDSNADGVGDLPGVTKRLDYLVKLGVDAIWLSPFYKSPMKDFGYDVSDYCDVDPIFGKLSDFDEMLKAAHEKGLKVLIDLVPNHTSDQHPWFIEAKSSTDNAKRNWYVWRDPGPDGGPPNNWYSFFGGPAWTFDQKSGQYYFHQFLTEQPDLNYRNPEVVEAMLNVMRFWLDRGVDGFRVDVIWLLVEDENFPDEPANPEWQPGMWDRFRTLHVYTDDQPETHDVVARMRKVLDNYSTPGEEKVMVGEIDLPYLQLISYYGTEERPECHLPFNFHLIHKGLKNWKPEVIRELVGNYERLIKPWQTPNWVLGNHDQARMATRLGSDQARVATMMLLLLRGTITWYYGDELGVLNANIPPEFLVDPAGLRQPDVAEVQRDPARTPMPWDETSFGGFSKTDPWLPMNADYKSRNVVVQARNTRSPYTLVATLLKLRKEHPALLYGRYMELNSQDGVFAFARIHEDESYSIILNMTNEKKGELPAGTVLLTTYLDDSPGRLRPNEGVLIKH